jgi:hypothetical protein
MDEQLECYVCDVLVNVADMVTVPQPNEDVLVCHKLACYEKASLDI